MSKILHPRRDHHGRLVEIRQPSEPSPLAAWLDPQAVATVVPDGPMPEALNGIALRSWTDHPQTAVAWDFVAGINTQLDEPPFHASGKSPAAGAVIIERDGRVWLVHPSNQFGGYAVTFPKGRQDPGLSLQATAIREAWEETGLHVRITGYLGDFARSQSMTRLYVAERVGGSPADMTWETQAVSLAPTSALETLLKHPNDQQVLVVLQQLWGEKQQ